MGWYDDSIGSTRESCWGDEQRAAIREAAEREDEESETIDPEAI